MSEADKWTAGVELAREDIKELSDLDRRCFDPGLAYGFVMMRSFVRRRDAFVWREYEGKELIGFVLVNLEGEIVTLDVHPKHRRQGLGRQLMRQGLRFLKQRRVKCAYSQVGTDNIPSLMLHLKFGFKIRYLLSDYYAPGLNAYHLVCEL